MIQLVFSGRLEINSPFWDRQKKTMSLIFPGRCHGSNTFPYFLENKQVDYGTCSRLLSLPSNELAAEQGSTLTQNRRSRKRDHHTERQSRRQNDIRVYLKYNIVNVSAKGANSQFFYAFEDKCFYTLLVFSNLHSH